MNGYSDTLGYANVLTDALTQAGLEGDKRAELVAIVAKMAIAMARITELEAENLRLLHYVTEAILDYIPNKQKEVPA